MLRLKKKKEKYNNVSKYKCYMLLLSSATYIRLKRR